MPRTARQKSESGIYHIMLRGINRQVIFADDEDNEKFLEVLKECKKISCFELYGYCLMGNHVHLLVKEGKEDLKQIFKRIGARYVYWYNWKYKRCGHLFQDRFKSEPVEDDAYFVTVLRYIHQNPVKAHLETIDKYEWSSYNEYIGNNGITDTALALSIIGESDFVNFMNEEVNDICLELKEDKRLTDKELAERIEKKFKIKAIMIQNEPREKMEQMLRKMLKLDGVSTRQLSRVTGVSTNIIWRL